MTSSDGVPDSAGFQEQAVEPDLVAEYFHRLNRVIPEEQKLTTVPSDCKIGDALQIMATKGYSQLPVMTDGKVVGVFTYRKFAQFVAPKDGEHWKRLGCCPSELTVDDCLERFAFAALTDEMTSVISDLERDGAVLVGSPDRLHGILTATDLVAYLHEVARPYVLILEIELCLREMIRRQLSSAQIAQAACEALRSLYEGEEHRIPRKLELMSFDNYRAIIVHPNYWPLFESCFSNMRRFDAKMRQIAELRNDIFHFKGARLDEYDDLVLHREWFLLRAMRFGASTREGGSVAAQD